MVKEGRNVFFTGSAGTGKSVLLREIIKLRDGPRSSRLGVTASTGIASVNIGGQTLHSWAGIGLGKGPAEMLAKKLLGQDKHLREQEAEQRRRIAKKYGMRPENVTLETDTTRVVDRWRDVRTLIIDEISMIDGELFDKLEYIARFLRGNTHPFGGIQVRHIDETGLDVSRSDDTSIQARSVW
ncbi:hypothetical protein B0H21DRAFT_428208 [Amylocystis lapponica]|nr:hypothetical protein B0H21DRAFT_428208 [Amylocystis lapponica]